MKRACFLHEIMHVFGMKVETQIGHETEIFVVCKSGMNLACLIAWIWHEYASNCMKIFQTSPRHFHNGMKYFHAMHDNGMNWHELAWIYFHKRLRHFHAMHEIGLKLHEKMCPENRVCPETMNRCVKNGMNWHEIIGMNVHESRLKKSAQKIGCAQTLCQ